MLLQKYDNACNTDEYLNWRLILLKFMVHKLVGFCHRYDNATPLERLGFEARHTFARSPATAHARFRQWNVIEHNSAANH